MLAIRFIAFIILLKHGGYQRTITFFKFLNHALQTSLIFTFFINFTTGITELLLESCLCHVLSPCSFWRVIMLHIFSSSLTISPSMSCCNESVVITMTRCKVMFYTVCQLCKETVSFSNATICQNRSIAVVQLGNWLIEEKETKFNLNNREKGLWKEV